MPTTFLQFSEADIGISGTWNLTARNSFGWLLLDCTLFATEHTRVLPPMPLMQLAVFSFPANPSCSRSTGKASSLVADLISAFEIEAVYSSWFRACSPTKEEDYLGILQNQGIIPTADKDHPYHYGFRGSI